MLMAVGKEGELEAHPDETKHIGNLEIRIEGEVSKSSLIIFRLNVWYISVISEQIMGSQT